MVNISKIIIFLPILLLYSLNAYSSSVISSISNSGDNIIVVINSAELHDGNIKIAGKTEQKIILNNANKYTDNLEPGSSIYKSGANSPVMGGNLVFSCGDCDIATFDDHARQIGGGDILCGYSSGVPLQIVRNQDQLCAKTAAGTLFDFNLLTWSAQGSCYDADNGDSCKEAGSQTSYIRATDSIFMDQAFSKSLPNSIVISGIDLESGREYSFEINSNEVADSQEFTYKGEKNLVFSIQADNSDDNDSTNGNSDSGMQLSALEIKVGTRSNKNLQGKADGYKLSSSAKPDDNIYVSARLVNKLAGSELKNAVMKVMIEEIDDNDNIEEETSEYDIRPGSSKEFKAQMRIPRVVEEGDYDVSISFEAEDESGKEYSIDKEFELTLEKLDHQLAIDKMELVPQLAKCDQDSRLQVSILNLGSNAEDVKVIASSKDPKISITNQNDRAIKLEADTEPMPVQFTVSANDSTAGNYPIQVSVFRNGNILEESKSAVLRVPNCQDPAQEYKKNENIRNKNIKSVENTAENKSVFVGVPIANSQKGFKFLPNLVIIIISITILFAMVLISILLIRLIKKR